MFTEKELNHLAGCCFRECEFLKQIEGCGIPTAGQQSEIMALRAKAIHLAQELQKKNALPAPEAKSE